MKRDFLMTVDVEALPSRTDKDHVRRLIWGDFGPSQPKAGVNEMVTIGDTTGVPFSFFVDMVEVEQHGDNIRSVDRHLHESSHPVELHLHPELLSQNYWESKGLPPPHKSQECYDQKVADILMSEFARELRQSTGTSDVRAYRAGSFRLGRTMLNAQHQENIRFSSNLSYETFVNQKRVPLAAPETGPFAWKEGPIEVPVTQFDRPQGWAVLAMPIKQYGDMGKKTSSYVLRKLAESDDRSPVVMILHSWSLLQYGEGRTFNGTAEFKIRRLEQLCKLAAELFNPIDFRDLARSAKNSELALGQSRGFPDALNQMGAYTARGFRIGPKNSERNAT